MIQRFDQIVVDLPIPTSPDANAAAAVQELMGGKYGEMSTLMNYTFQSFNLRGRSKVRPFYDLIASIATEEYGHIEAVAYAINLLLTGATGPRVSRNEAAAPAGKSPAKAKGKKTAAVPASASSPDLDDPAPLAEARHNRFSYHYLASGQAALPYDSMGNPWTGANVTSTGSLKTDLLHNFFLECGARANKMRVYDMAESPTARALVGYLLVSGGTHIVAYAKALEKLTGADVGRLLPIPDMSNKRFPEARKLEDQGRHLTLFRHSPTDYTRFGEIWNGPHPETGEELTVLEGMPPGFAVPDLEEEPHLGAPGDQLDPDMLEHYSKKLG